MSNRRINLFEIIIIRIRLSNSYRWSGRDVIVVIDEVAVDDVAVDDIAIDDVVVILIYWLIRSYCSETARIRTNLLFFFF